MKTIFHGILILFVLQSCITERSSITGYDYVEDTRGLYGGSDFSENNIRPDDDLYFGETKKLNKIIRSATMHMTVKQTDSIPEKLGEIAGKYKGYIKESGSYYSTIRVEASYLDKAIEEISLLGRVDSKTIHGMDVSDDYLDKQIRLENAEKARIRYLELLEKAENVEAALLVEKELERLNGTIEMLKGQLNQTDHLVAYSTISVYAKEKKKPGLLGYIGIGLYKSVKWLFVRN